jgi:hypothetical protein
MLEPRDRQLLFEALRPADGFRFDQGLGTTYSLDLLALLMAPLAFTWFEQPGEEGQRSGFDSLEVLESLRRHADQLTIFCHAGRTALPKASYPQLAFVENSIIECQPSSGGAFHPKVWVLRCVNDAGEVQYRVLCLSRNLTFARSWDTILALDGKLVANRTATVARNRGLVEFVRALPRAALRQPVDPGITQRMEMLASELDHTEFDLPDGMTELRFWPLGIGERTRDPLSGAGSRLLVVSPFVTAGRLENLADERKEVTVVSTATALAHLTRRPAGVGSFYSLLDRAVPEADPEGEDKPQSEAEAIQLSDLHAKLYISENGWDAHIWTGSANATDSGFSRNVEFLVELVGPRSKFGIDTLMKHEKGEVRFVDLLGEADRFVATEPEESETEALERRLDALRCAIAGAILEAQVNSVQADAFDVKLVSRGAVAVAIDPGITLTCWPVTVAGSMRVSVEKLEPNGVVGSFAGLSFPAITSFFAFELTGRACGEQRQLRFVLNLPLIGAPEGRREQVLRSLLKDRSRMMHFLWLLLADEGVPVPELTGADAREAVGGNERSSVSTNGLFEMLLRNLGRTPERLDNLESLLKELRRGAEGEDLMPVGFDAIWEPIWRQRERRRVRSQA